jgi:hypothetical protein
LECGDGPGLTAPHPEAPLAFPLQFSVFVMDLTALGTLAGSFSEAHGINDLGPIVGESETASSEDRVLPVGERGDG